MMPWEHKKILQHKHYILIFYCNFFYNDQFGYANLLMVFKNLGDMFISHSRQGSFFSVFRKEKCLLLNAKSKGASLSQNRRCSSFIVSVDKKKIIQKKNSPKRQLLALVPLPTFFFFFVFKLFLLKHSQCYCWYQFLSFADMELFHVRLLLLL